MAQVYVSAGMLKNGGLSECIYILYISNSVWYMIYSTYLKILILLSVCVSISLHITSLMNIY